MGNVRTPKIIYKHGLVMEFYVKNKEIYYRIFVWSKDGMNRSLIEENALNGRDYIQVFKQALQSFSSVGVIEN